MGEERLNHGVGCQRGRALHGTNFFAVLMKIYNHGMGTGTGTGEMENRGMVRGGARHGIA